MKKQTKKILLSVGALTTIVTPISVVISCGIKTDQEKLDSITNDMLKKAVNITPSKKITASIIASLIKTYPLKYNIINTTNLNGLSNLKIIIIDVKANDTTATLNLTVLVSKKGLKSKTFKFTLNGFKHI